MNNLEKQIRWQTVRPADGPPRVCAWFGPCPYSNDDLGFRIDPPPASPSPSQSQPQAAGGWPDAPLDLLHRIINFTGKNFNSCLCEMLRSGREALSWHCEEQPVIGPDPFVGFVSMGRYISALARLGFSPLKIRFFSSPSGFCGLGS